MYISGSNYYHHQLYNTKTLALVGRGNLTDLKSKSSLSKAKLEYLSSQRFADDNWDDLILLQKNYILKILVIKSRGIYNNILLESLLWYICLQKNNLKY